MDEASPPQINKRTAVDADALTALNQQASPLLRLPPELRNRIYEYAFTEPCVLVRRSLSARFHLLVEPAQYAFSNLLATTTACRQMHAEASLLPFHLNVFRFHHLETVQEFTQWVTPVQLRAVAKLRLSLFLPLIDKRIGALATANMRSFAGLVKIIVETRHWRLDDLVFNQTQSKSAYLQQERKMLESCMQRAIEIVVE